VFRAGVGILARRGAVRLFLQLRDSAGLPLPAAQPSTALQGAVTGFPLMALACGREATPAMCDCGLSLVGPGYWVNLR